MIPYLRAVDVTNIAINMLCNKSYKLAYCEFDFINNVNSIA